MANITEQLIYSTVRLVGAKDEGISVGTGFFFQCQENKLFLVTNKHVIKGVKNGEFFMKRGMLIQNGLMTIPASGSVALMFTENDFVGHPDPDVDVAVMEVTDYINNLIVAGTPAHYIAIIERYIPNENQMNTTIKHIENIVFVGYPDGLWDEVNFAPIIRTGITATPYIYDFRGKKIFLVDASVFGGSSGSPVFILDIGLHIDKEGIVFQGNRVHFLGIIASVYYVDEEGDIQEREIPVKKELYASTKQMIDLGVVFKASTVTETISEYKRRLL